MNYCKNCGAKLDEQDDFCSNCGTGTGDNAESYRHETFQYHQPYAGVPENETLHKLSCELAYSGILFWLPLLLCPKNEYAKHSANQGLWVLIISAVACWTIQILEAVKGLFAGWIVGSMLNGIYVLLFIMFLFFMFYMAFNCYRCAMAIHRDEKPESILFFEERPIIK